MSGTTAQALPAAALSQVLDALTDGVVVFDADWTVAYVNPAGAALLRRSTGELVDRNLWVALPECGGSLLHRFLLQARSAGTPVTWSGYYPPAGRRLSATATVGDGGLLQVSFRATDQQDAPDLDVAEEAAADEDAGHRLRYLSDVSETMIATLDSGESATRLAELVVSRLCDWAVVAIGDEHGGVGEKAWAHRDPARRADLDRYMTERREGTGDDTAMIDALLTGQPVRVPIIHDEVVAPSLPTEQLRATWRGRSATGGDRESVV